jgi:hypothetical protein
MNVRNSLFRLLFIALLVAGLGRGPAHAGMIGTDQAAAGPADRAQVMQRLQDLGVPADQVRGRVEAMSEEELASVARHLDTLPAGGALSNTDLIIILLIILLVAVLV